jgi:hypothetical protein
MRGSTSNGLAGADFLGYPFAGELLGGQQPFILFFSLFITKMADTRNLS